MRKGTDIFKYKLNQLIRSSDLNPTSFARAAGFYQGQVYRWISGENTPGLEILDRIAAFFGVPAASLISEETSEPVIRKPTPEEALEIIGEVIKNRHNAHLDKKLLTPIQTEIISALPSLDESECRAVLRLIHAAQKQRLSDSGQSKKKIRED